MNNDQKNFKKAYEEYKNGPEKINERKSVENFIKQNINKKKTKNKKNGKNVNFVDQLDKKKNIAEVINIESFKEYNIITDEDEYDGNNNMEIEKTDEMIQKSCTCGIY